MTPLRALEHRTASPHDLLRVLLAKGIRDPRIFGAFHAVPRELFVPAEHIDEAYLDVPLPIGHGQVATQPSLVAQMVEALRLCGSEKVLEVGTGLGFQTAILAVLCREVISIERFEELALAAVANLESVGIGNASVFVGDGSLGVREHAPYDAIVTAAAAPQVPPPLVGQLADHGRLVHPFGSSGSEVIVALRKERDALVVERHITVAQLVPMAVACGVGAKHEPR